MNKQRKKWKIFLSAVLLSTSLFLQGLTVHADNDIETRLAQQREMEIQSNLIEGWPEGPVVSAESAILIEAATGTILYAKNIHQQEYPASTTKILTTLLATELCDLDEVVTFSHNAVFDNPAGSSGIAMDVGQALTMEQCLNAILIRSANEVAFAVAEHISGTTDWSVFAETMNNRAKELGALNTHFANPNGLPDENHYTTAYDLAMIGRAFFDNKLLCDISLTRRMEIPASDTLPEAKIENSSMQIIPGGKYEYEYLVGCKTGYTVAARSSLVSCAEKDGLKLICVVMRDESPLQYEDTISLYNWGFSNFRKMNVSQVETKYNIDAAGADYSDSDIFGSVQPLLSLNKEDCIVVPADMDISQTTTSISYNTGDPNLAALISYSYKDVPLGTVRLHFTSGNSTSYVFDSQTTDAEQVNIAASSDEVKIDKDKKGKDKKNEENSNRKILIIAGIVLGITILLLILYLIIRSSGNRPDYLTDSGNRHAWKKRRKRRRNANRPPNRNRDYNF